ncbi:NAD-dependent deacylase [Marinovum sp. 2_MG-2023]|uniref:NAD-dependent deacylase n=1 Tax=unclassified Marinovum TaxID=2647166 RepID=UPI0026E43830|nr:MULTISPECIES: NAD-dependent deacylase [unclassified Marinovum]MDO6728716.1 NAD-dependent deacylase [Marinovum sp. 2_MG-2023]MDO6777868.1 NAD-dependent deacylase [Marinovum sp. 1_MG-2023]
MRNIRQKIVILTGAGISAESGLGTFRDAQGLWAQHAIEDVATPEGFARDPGLVHSFYNARRAQAAAASPNAAHHALARLEAEFPGEVVLVTQNVDDLHHRAGSQNILQMHGKLAGALCGACGLRWPAPIVMTPDTPCPDCSQPAARPDVVWFGEFPHHMAEIGDHLAGCDLFAAIGTSGQVYPAASFVEEARNVGAETVELSLEPTAVSHLFNHCHSGPATETVPRWVASVLGYGALA